MQATQGAVFTGIEKTHPCVKKKEKQKKILMLYLLEQSSFLFGNNVSGQVSHHRYTRVCAKLFSSFLIETLK